MCDDFDNFFFEEDTLGMTITSGVVTVKKDTNNLLGISIGGGSPNCPCLYIVQVYDGTMVQKDGTLEAGDEITSICGKPVKGKSKTEIATIIQNSPEEVVVGYNKLHADPKQGKSLDIILKKVKHRLIEKMSSSTADALGLSRAILRNDSLCKKLQDLDRNELVYKHLMEFGNSIAKSYSELIKGLRGMYDVFSIIASREPQARASETFRLFAEQHKNMDKIQQQFVDNLKPILADIETYLTKAIPDMKLTIKKYADQKFEYLSYCLKVKEMDDEETNSLQIEEPLYRLETGNYEYRLTLRCRQLSREKFSELRTDVTTKLELLDQKHLETLVKRLTALMSNLKEMFRNISELSDNTKPLFPIEIDLAKNAFEYTSIQIPKISEYTDCEEYVTKEEKVSKHTWNSKQHNKDETVRLLNDLKF